MYCLYFICERKFYARTHLKITRHWKALLLSPYNRAGFHLKRVSPFQCLYSNAGKTHVVPIGIKRLKSRKDFRNRNKISCIAVRIVGVQKAETHYLFTLFPEACERSSLNG